jgi:hypothetical protein
MFLPLLRGEDQGEEVVTSDFFLGFESDVDGSNQFPEMKRKVSF